MGIKIQDVAYVRFSAPDLDAMEAFLIDFGMVRAVRTTDTLYMRGPSRRSSETFSPRANVSRSPICLSATITFT